MPVTLFLCASGRRYHQPTVDGYTVEEAASVLGVPRERVWELLARGVISGATDLAGSMRIRLKVDPPPEAPPQPSGDGGQQASGEMTPFRELLTEFRSLTERYGQALLALGEARGEVAGLRSRVDMLEARIELRLPSAAQPPVSSTWSATPWPTPHERVVESPIEGGRPPPRVAHAMPEPHESDADASGSDPEEERSSHRRRGRAGRHATERFADALARAEDPSPPELPGAAETAAALAALRQDLAVEAPRGQKSDDADEASLPRELPAADVVPVADEAASFPSPAADQGSEEELVREDADLTAAQGGPDAEVADAPRISPDWDRTRYSAAIEEPGWMAEEVAAPTSAPEAPPPRPPASSGSPELDEGLAALDALAHPQPPPLDDAALPEPLETAAPAVEPREPAAAAERLDVAASATTTRSQAWTRPPFSAPVAPRSPASRAYRRLRRIFPT